VPRYDYRCTACGEGFELVQSFKEAGSGTCPVCSGAGQRVFHAVPVIYKGSGFYTTDYGRPKPPVENGGKETKETSTASSGKDNNSSSDSGSKTETKTESAAPAASESSS
jgi:putative FmdB family regulatory protein